jgi:hypothetical protein
MWDKDFHARIHKAWHDFLADHPGPGYDQKWLAKEVGQIVKGSAYDPSTASWWMAGRVPGRGGVETLEILAALAHVLGIQPGPLAFGGPLESLPDPLEPDEETGH